MQTKILKITPPQVNAPQVKAAAQVIDSGGLVGFPTETVYGIACRVEKSSLDKLSHLKQRQPDKFYTLHIGDRQIIHKYVPDMGLRSEKLVKNFMPGPITVVFSLSPQQLQKVQKTINSEVFECLYRDNSIGIRCPENTTASLLLRLAHYPVVAPSANTAGSSPAVTGQQVLDYFDGQLDIVIDEGECKYKQSSTVLKITQNKLEILRQGVISQETIEKTSTVQILLVCTGNTCRSPMAEGMMKKYISEKLSCGLDQLEKNGYKVCSAGTMGISGMPASPEAAAACAKYSIDIRKHRSTGLSKEIIEESDIIYTMSRKHLQRIVDLDAEAEKKCVLLADNEDVPDPIGCGQEYYDKCLDMIERAVKKRISELRL